jgi:hypothetical protein
MFQFNSIGTRFTGTKWNVEFPISILGIPAYKKHISLEKLLNKLRSGAKML